MKVTANGRQAGKTYALVEWVREGERTDSYPGWSRVILTHSCDEARRVRSLYRLDYRQVFSVNEWKDFRLGSGSVEIAVDNVDILLHHMIDQRPNIVTMTGHVD